MYAQIFYFYINGLQLVNAPKSPLCHTQKMKKQQQQQSE